MTTTFRLWDGVTPTIGNVKPLDATLSTEFTLSEDQGVYGIWTYSAPAAVALPSACVIWSVSDQSKVNRTENLSPSWSGAAGSGWVRCAYDGTVVLTAGARYIVSVYHDASAAWRGNTGSYWTNGDGSSGITNGPISAFSESTSTNGQCAIATGYEFPDLDGQGQNFWTDIEVGDALVLTPGTANAGQASTRASGGNASASVSVTSSGGATATNRSSAATVRPANASATTARAVNAT